MGSYISIFADYGSLLHVLFLFKIDHDNGTVNKARHFLSHFLARYKTYIDRNLIYRHRATTSINYKPLSLNGPRDLIGPLSGLVFNMNAVKLYPSMWGTQTGYEWKPRELEISIVPSFASFLLAVHELWRVEYGQHTCFCSIFALFGAIVRVFNTWNFAQLYFACPIHLTN